MLARRSPHLQRAFTVRQLVVAEAAWMAPGGSSRCKQVRRRSEEEAEIAGVGEVGSLEVGEW
eukprot:CAMPEP_0206422616 /NCGR_PEP_ID=MMETSP0324_2-20121206/2199_1 /ASSEMBLY_ACC=CAM_ASM_000836 /TAXON_ID=2866 /ORGANISM="Crypthecodinium cohnii, Strain Seligo" /LENGTH=61 /DNA_ID=CAMNT_0053887035 /DNA_START=179 /DNA_END=364 /DNA_ORIENTATION=+